MKTAVITGGTGYIGSNLTRYLLERGWKITLIVRRSSTKHYIEDLLNQVDLFYYDGNVSDLVSYFSRHRADVVFHLAASVLSPCRIEQIHTLVESNILFGTELLEAMRAGNTRLFINTGTYWQNYNCEKYNPVDLYAATKEAFEKILQYYTDAYGFRAVTLRLFDTYGVGDLRPKLLNKLCQIAGSGEQIDISPGEQLLDMVYVSDVCHAYECAYAWLESNLEVRNETYGVYTGDLVMLKELVLLLEKVFQKEIHVNLGGKSYKEREVMKPVYSSPLLPNWSAAISLREGLIKARNSFLDSL